MTPLPGAAEPRSVPPHAPTPDTAGRPAGGGSTPGQLLGYATAARQEVLGAGERPRTHGKPSAPAHEPRGRWFMGTLVLSLVAWGGYRVWSAFLRYEAYGVVVGREVRISPPWNGEVLAVHVRDGERIERGELLCTLSNLALGHDRTRLHDELLIAQADMVAQMSRLDLQKGEVSDRVHKAGAEYREAWAQLLQEQAQADILQRSLERTLKLYQSGVASEEELETLRERAGGQADKVQQLQKAVEELRARREEQPEIGEGLEQLRPFELRIEKLQADLTRTAERLSQGEVRAPVSGIVMHRDCFVGEQATPDRPLLTILEEGSEHIELFLPQSQAAELWPGSELYVEIEPNPGLVPCQVLSLGDAYTSPPLNVARHTRVGELLLPVRLAPRPEPGRRFELRIGALAKKPRSLP